jgi:hypothetical protein
VGIDFPRRYAVFPRIVRVSDFALVCPPRSVIAPHHAPQRRPQVDDEANHQVRRLRTE